RGERVIPGEAAFRLYDTYGFPLGLTGEIAAERDFQVDYEGFDRAMEEQRRRARAARAETGYLGDATTDGYGLADGVQSRFVGYDRLEHTSRVLGLRVGGRPVSRAEPGDETVEVVLAETPFYPEGGGQVLDTGT